MFHYTVETDKGQSKFGMPKPTVMMGVVNDSALAEIAQGVEETLIKALEEAK